jgi:D-arabinitol dehydrogenase (NADP+)
MQAAQILSPTHLQIIEIPQPEASPGEVVIAVQASGICGTDIHIYRGEYLGAYPVIPGHEFAGVVTAVGEGVTRYKPGDRVAVEPNIACDNCWHCLNNRQNFCQNWQAVGVTRPGGMAQYVSAPERAVFSVGELSFEAGAFVEPLSCVLHGLERLGAELGCNALIVGAGPIGILLLQGLRLQGAARVTVADKNAARAESALGYGADAALPGMDAAQKDTYDVVIDATGVPAVQALTLDYARPGGKVLWFGVPPAGQMVSLEAFQVFRKGLTVLSSFTSVRNSYQALSLLQSGRIRVDGLVSHRLPLEELEHGIHLLEGGLEGVRKVHALPNG